MAKKVKKPRVPRTRNNETMTEAAFWSWIRSALRQKSRWWKPIAEAKKMGIDLEEKEDGLILSASDKLTGASLNSENDHRLFMAFCIAGMYVGDCTVSDPESVAVSYPKFIEEMQSIGAKISVQ